MKSNAQLQKDIEDELACEPSVDAAAIGVAVADGTGPNVNNSERQRNAKQHERTPEVDGRAVISEAQAAARPSVFSSTTIGETATAAFLAEIRRTPSSSVALTRSGSMGTGRSNCRSSFFSVNSEK